MTKKLFLEHSYDTQFDAAVVACTAADEGRYHVVLEQTLFYPESGGQLCDTGTLGGGRVLAVREDGEAVVHEIAAPAPPSGTVSGQIDWPMRFDHMQQHTGQHVLSRSFIETDDLHTVSFHMGSDSCTIDLEGKYSDAAAPRAEKLANDIIEQNRTLSVKTVPVADLDADGLRRKVPAGISEARIVEIEGFDAIPCCGTHVRSTGELALIKVLRSEKVKNTQRVYFKCGRRARADYEGKHDLVSRIAARFTTSPDGIVDNIEKLVASEAAAQKRARRLAERLVVAEARDLMALAAGKIVVHFDPALDAAYLRMLSNELRRQAGAVAILAGADGVVVCVASDDVGVDIAAVATPLARSAGGSGGGKNGFAQLKLPADSDVQSILEKIRDHVKAAM